MKIQAIILIAAISLFTLQTQAVERVTGPKVKNVKSSERLANVEKVTIEKVEPVKGPENKNVKATERLANVEKTTTQKVDVLKGPKAKNYRPYRK